MNISFRLLSLGLIGLGFTAVILAGAQAGGKHFYPPVTDALVKEECGSCHLAFAPSMLPARSWQKMMGELDHHFGDDASLDEATAARITAYLVANAAENSGKKAKLQRGLAQDAVPLRISELPKWLDEHRKVPDWEWRHKEVRSKANCQACHLGAEQGYYDD